MRIYDATGFCLFGIRKGEKVFGSNFLSVRDLGWIPLSSVDTSSSLSD